MPDETIQLIINLSILEKNDKFAVQIHQGNGERINQSGFIYDTKEAARRDGIELLNCGLKAIQERGYPVDGLEVMQAFADDTW